MEDSVPLEEALPKGQASPLTLGQVERGSVPIPTAIHVTKDLTLNAEVANGRKCHFHCTWTCGFEPQSENQKIQGNSKVTRGLWLRD